MRLRNITGSNEVIANSPYVKQNPESYKGKWSTVFDENQPIYIEIGMGKGQFILNMAKNNPTINFIGIEKYSSVLLRALQKMEEKPLSNLLFIRMDAEDINEVFGKEEVSKIYLNFSDPWPKDRHARRRLPSKEFLMRYDKILKKSGKIEFKTDNFDLFTFALEELEQTDWHKEAVSFDLHGNAELMKDNVMTEYEEKFSSLGNKICKYTISR